MRLFYKFIGHNCAPGRVHLPPCEMALPSSEAKGLPIIRIRNQICQWEYRERDPDPDSLELKRIDRCRALLIQPNHSDGRLLSDDMGENISLQINNLGNSAEDGMHSGYCDCPPQSNKLKKKGVPWCLNSRRWSERRSGKRECYIARGRCTDRSHHSFLHHRDKDVPVDQCDHRKEEDQKHCQTPCIAGKTEREMVCHESIP